MITMADLAYDARRITLAEMEAYDALPDAIRKRIRESPFPLNPIMIADDVRQYGEARIIQCLDTGLEPDEIHDA